MWFDLPLFRRKNTYKTLAIIGNGFDKAHGYDTDYKAFAQRVSSPHLSQFKAYCDEESSITTWYLFEENIRILTEKLFLQSYAEDCDFDANRKEVEKVRTIFRGIHDLLSDYLRNETAKHPLKKKKSITDHLTSKDVAINFNYTDTAEQYTKNIFYVHGSLAENDILLGYDHREEPCLAQYEDMCWSKTLCREALTFRRYLQKRCRLSPSSKKYKKILSGLEAYQHWENTGRGLEDEVTRSIPAYKFVNRLMKKIRRNNEAPNISYTKVDTLLIIGHGIEADRAYLDTILSQCTNLNKIILYRYDTEPDESIEQKKSFLLPYCTNIETINY